VCCQVEVSASGRSLVQRSPTDCGVSEGNREPSKMRRLWPSRGCCATLWEGMLLVDLGVFHILQKFMIIIHSEGLNNFYFAQNIERSVRSRMCGVRLVVHIKTSGRKP